MNSVEPESRVNAEDEPRPVAFVIMPFAASFDVVWKIIRQPLESAGYIAKRADTDPSHGSVLGDIVRGIATARLVVADLTSSNANVFYELGLCHGLRIPTILITQGLEQVPFDLRMYHIETYGTEYSAAQDFQGRLENTASRYLRRELEFGSPVVDYLPTTVRPIDGGQRPLDGRQLEAKREALHALTTALKAPTLAVLQTFAEVLEPWQDNYEQLDKLAKQLDALDQDAGEASRVAIQQVASEAKAVVEGYTDLVEARITVMAEQVRHLTEAGAGLSVALDVDLGEGPLRHNIEAFRNALESTYQGATGAIQAASAYKVLVLRFKEQHAELDPALGRVERVMDSFMTSSLALQAYALGTANLLHDRLAEG